MKWYLVKDLGEEQDIIAFEQKYRENEGKHTEKKKPSTFHRSRASHHVYQGSSSGGRLGPQKGGANTNPK